MGWCGHCKKISGFLLTLTRANIYLNFLAHFILPCADAFFLHFTFPSFTNSCCIICRSPSRGKTFFGIAVLHADAIVLLLLMLLLFFCCCCCFSFSFYTLWQNNKLIWTEVWVHKKTLWKMGNAVRCRRWRLSWLWIDNTTRSDRHCG